MTHRALIGTQSAGPRFNKLVDRDNGLLSPQPHQDRGIKVPDFLISHSYFIIIDLKLVIGYSANSGEFRGKFALVN